MNVYRYRTSSAIPGLPARGFAVLLALALTLACAITQAQTLNSVVSRKTHVLPNGTYDLPISVGPAIGGAVTFESRDIGGGHQIVFQFAAPISQPGTATAVDAALVAIGSATAALNPANASEVIVTLNSIPDNRRVSVSLSGVDGNPQTHVVAVGFRVGDTDNSGTLSFGDISSIKARAGQAASNLNFRYDLNVSGAVTAADISAAKVRSGLYVVNTPPVVSAGTNQTVALPTSAALAGTASDDGLPNPPAAISVAWAKFSGPSSVTFGNANALNTSASFGGPGTYVLRLTASDSLLSSSADVTVTVNPGSAASFTLSGLASAQTAGTAGNLTVTARDTFGNIATGYRGTVHFTSSDGAAVLPANYTFTGTDNGAHAFPVTFNTVGSQSISVVDTVTGTIVGSQSGITVASAALPGLFEKLHGWNKDVSAFPVSPRSAAITAALTSFGGWGNGNKLQIDFSIAVLYADSTTPRRTITGPFDYCYGPGSPDCDPVPLQMPIPVNGNTEGSADYTCPNPGDDCHVLVVERTEKKLYELYQGNGTASSFDAYGAFVWDLTKQYGDVLRGDQCTSADAAGLPMAALIPTADEVAAGVVPHAIRFILPNPRMKQGVYVRPATHAGGPSSTNPDAPPYGVRFRLKSSFSETGFSAGAKVILQALKKYGMILSDGGNIALTFADDRLSTAKWANLGITAQTFNAIGVSNFDVVDLGAEIPLTYDCVRAP